MHLHRHRWAFVCILITLGVSLSSAQQWQPMAGIADRFLDLKVSPTGDTLLAITDQDSLYLSIDGGQNWRRSEGWLSGGVTAIEFHYQDSHPIILASRRGLPPLGRSTDFGATWMSVATAPYTLSRTQLERDPWQRLWAVGGPNPYYSDDQGVTWDSLPAPTQTVRGLWVSPQDPEQIWIAGGAAGAFHSTNGGLTWLAAGLADTVVMVEGNPLNPGSAIVATSAGCFYWNHGNGQWQLLPYPLPELVPGVEPEPSLLFQNGDSTWLAAASGYALSEHNLLASHDGGQSWTRLGGTALTAISVRRLVRPGRYDGPLAALFDGGAILWSPQSPGLQHVSAGCYVENYSFWISRRQAGLIWIRKNYGIYVSANAGQQWQPTPLALGGAIQQDHPARPAVLVTNHLSLAYWVDYPSLQVERFALAFPDSSYLFSLRVSPADTQRYYAVTVVYPGGGWDAVYRLWASDDRMQSWQPLARPGDSTDAYEIFPSATEPNSLLLGKTLGGFESPECMAWRSDDNGQHWRVVFNAMWPDWANVLQDCWSEDDPLTAFHVTVTQGALTSPFSSQTWHYYSTDGGEHFDSVLVMPDDTTGYFPQAWGDAVWGDVLLGRRVSNFDENDSVFVSRDQGHTFQPIVVQNDRHWEWLTLGPGLQLVSVNLQYCTASYWSPYSASENPARPAPPTEIGMALYPNPTNSQVTLTLDLPPGVAPTGVSIYNTLGQLAAKLPITAAVGTRHLNLPIAYLSSGVYFVRLDLPNQPTGHLRKLVILR